MPGTVSVGDSGRVVSVNVSDETGMRKAPVERIVLVDDHGIEGDAHAGDWHRQVSLLARESIDKMVAAGLDVTAGDFAENVTTEGIDLDALPIGTRISVGEDVVLEISQIGKVCHNRCAIYYQAGDCVMPKEGIFGVVRRAGAVAAGGEVVVLEVGDGTCDRVPDPGQDLPKTGEWRGMGALKVAILTCSDTRALAEDTAGAALAGLCAEAGWEVVEHLVIPDEFTTICVELERLADEAGADVVLTCGGTGFSPRDVTPEATAAVCERMAPGIAEAMRAGSLSVTRRAMLSRAAAGLRGTALIVNLPGSRKAAVECFGFVADQFEHAREMMAGGGH